MLISVGSHTPKLLIFFNTFIEFYGSSFPLSFFFFFPMF